MGTSTFHNDLRNFLFRSNPVPMFLYDGTSLSILGANDAANAKYGYSLREFHSMTIRDLRPSGNEPALGTAIHIDHDTPSHSLWTHINKAGLIFPVEVQIAPLQRGHRKLCLMSAVDASAWSDDRLKLAQSQDIHRSLIDECPFGIYRFNLTASRYEQANPALLEILGYTLEEFLVTRASAFFIDSADRDHLLAELRTSGRIRDYETCFRKKDGGILRVSISGFLGTNAETRQQYIHVYVHDITPQRELEEQLHHTQRMEAVGRLAGGVAHDFNNITQSISLSCELALRNQVAPAIESKFLDIMEQSARAAEITRQLLAFSRRQLLQPRSVNLNACVRKAFAMLTRVVGPDISLDLQLDESVQNIFIDPDQLDIVLMHLASNAHAAMPQGGTMRIATSFFRPGNSGKSKNSFSEPCAVLTVSDTGVGMDERTLNRIFEPFFSTKETALTSGLGLATVHGIVAQSKGSIECESTLGHGSTFRIFLPIAAQPADTTSRTSDNKPYRVLLAEDDPFVSKHLNNAILKAGFTVDSVANGEEALAAFQRQHYHIVVSDIIMPKLGGVELTKRLRQRLPSFPIILISGYSEEINVLQHVPHNHIAYLQKPFPSSQLIAAIHTLLSPNEETADGLPSGSKNEEGVRLLREVKISTAPKNEIHREKKA
jgi:PAS domain S-box-containing protein